MILSDMNQTHDLFSFFGVSRHSSEGVVPAVAQELNALGSHGNIYVISILFGKQHDENH